MDGASGGPRSARELAEAARGLKELLDTGLLSQDAHDAAIAALRAEAAEFVAATRARSSVGDAGSPMPTRRATAQDTAQAGLQPCTAARIRRVRLSCLRCRGCLPSAAAPRLASALSAAASADAAPPRRCSMR